MATKRKANPKAAWPNIRKIALYIFFSSLFTWGGAHYYVSVYGGIWPDYPFWLAVKDHIEWLVPIIGALGIIPILHELYRKGGRN